MADTGLPALPASVNVFNDVVLLASDLISAFIFGPQMWGIYLDGAPVVLADNVVSVDYKQEWRLSKYPQEQGAFATYNKVSTPFETVVKFSTGGSVVDRQNFIDSVAAIAGDLNLYDVVTPEQIYLNCNVVRYDYDRKADKAGIIMIEIGLEEVRIAGASTFSNTQSPSAAGNMDNGLVQPDSLQNGQQSGIPAGFDPGTVQ